MQSAAEIKRELAATLFMALDAAGAAAKYGMEWEDTRIEEFADEVGELCNILGIRSLIEIARSEPRPLIAMENDRELLKAVIAEERRHLGIESNSTDAVSAVSPDFGEKGPIRDAGIVELRGPWPHSFWGSLTETPSLTLQYTANDGTVLRTRAKAVFEHLEFVRGWITIIETHSAKEFVAAMNGERLPVESSSTLLLGPRLRISRNELGEKTFFVPSGVQTEFCGQADNCEGTQSLIAVSRNDSESCPQAIDAAADTVQKKRRGPKPKLNESERQQLKELWESFDRWLESDGQGVRMQDRYKKYAEHIGIIDGTVEEGLRKARNHRLHD